MVLKLKVQLMVGHMNRWLITYKSKIAYHTCEHNFTEIREFNLMFKTFQGVTEDAKNTVYLRPETAQGIFVNFKNVQRTSEERFLSELVRLVNHLEMKLHLVTLHSEQENLNRWN